MIGTKYLTPYYSTQGIDDPMFVIIILFITLFILIFFLRDK